MKLRHPLERTIDAMALRATESIGSPLSLFLHSVFFIGIFGLALAGIDIDAILLILTTVVSLEAIYLAIFIQMTVNRQTQQLAEVSEDIEDIAEEVDELAEDIEEDDREDDIEHARDVARIKRIEDAISLLHDEIKNLKSKK